MATWLPEPARILGARRPMRLSVTLARPMVGDYEGSFMTESRGADNTLACATLGWRPSHPTWRDGFRAEPAAGAR